MLDRIHVVRSGCACSVRAIFTKDLHDNCSARERILDRKSLGLVHVVSSGSRSDSLAWRCRRIGCQKRVSVRCGTMFEGSKLPLGKILYLLYLLAKDLSVVKAAEEVLVSDSTAVEWYAKIREMCAEYLLCTSKAIGGVSHTVEIDEAKFGTRKYMIFYIIISFNRRMKQLMDWLSNPH